jgi:hypothetical protein
MYSQTAAQSGCTGLSDGAPDSVRWCRTSPDEQPTLGSRRRRTAINHRTVRWCNGLSGESSAAKSPLSGNSQQRTAKIHRTVRWCTGLFGEPTVGRAIHAWRVAEPTVWWGHRTIRCAPDSVRCANGYKSSTVGCANLGRRSAPDSETVDVRWCTGLSGAPPDRRQELPSWNASNGS